MNKYKYRSITFFHRELAWPIKKVKFGDYKISRKVKALVKNLPQKDDLTQAIHSIHNDCLTLMTRVNGFSNKKRAYYYQHTHAIQDCLDAIYLLGNCQFFISEFYNQQDKMQLVETNNNHLLRTLYLYFVVKKSEFKEQDFKAIQELMKRDYSVQHKIGILSCNLHGLEKLAEVNLITALKQDQNEGQLINIIQMLKYLYTKSPSKFSCNEDVKEEILSIINNKYNVLPKLIEKCRNDFDENVQSEFKYDITCAIL